MKILLLAFGFLILSDFWFCFHEKHRLSTFSFQSLLLTPDFCSTHAHRTRGKWENSISPWLFPTQNLLTFALPCKSGTLNREYYKEFGEHYQENENWFLKYPKNILFQGGIATPEFSILGYLASSAVGTRLSNRVKRSLI